FGQQAAGLQLAVAVHPARPERQCQHRQRRDDGQRDHEFDQAETTPCSHDYQSTRPAAPQRSPTRRAGGVLARVSTQPWSLSWWRQVAVAAYWVLSLLMWKLKSSESADGCQPVTTVPASASATGYQRVRWRRFSRWAPRAARSVWATRSLLRST